MAQEPLKPAYVIWGEDRATIDRALGRLIARVAREGGMAPERFRAEEYPPEDVVAACEALSFAGVRLVLVEGADAWKADGVGVLLDYLGAANPGTCLALVAGGQLTPKLHAAIAELGGELRYGPDPKAKGRERTQWLVEHFRSEVQRAGGSASGRSTTTRSTTARATAADADPPARCTSLRKCSTSHCVRSRPFAFGSGP